MRKIGARAGALLLCFAALTTWAGVYTESHGYGGTLSFTDLAVSFQQYNAAAHPGETLVGIEVILDLTAAGGYVQFDNDSGSVQFGNTATLSGTVTGASTDVTLPLLTSTATASSGAQTIPAHTGSDAVDGFQWEGDADNYQFAMPIEGATASVTVAATDWTGGTTGFLGAGTFEILLAGSGASGALAGSTVRYIGVSPTSATGLATVRYTTTGHVPEPGSAGLLLLGLAAGLCRRRR